MSKSIVIFVVIITCFFLVSCGAGSPKETPYDLVDVFIGTGGHGHTFPGASLPFGMVQLSPDTRNDDSWDGCGGYHYSDQSIIGFSHTHLSGTGVSDYGDILFMPVVGTVKTETGTRDNPDSGYRSKFKHESESASPGFYSVFLEDYGVRAEMTVTQRVGFHKYTFPDSDEAHMLIDLRHRDPVMEAEFSITGQNEISGYRRSKFWAGDQRVYFVARFNASFKSFEIHCDGSTEKQEKSVKGKNILGLLNFTASSKEPILVKVGISAVSIDGARKNLEAELAHWDFDKTKRAAKQTWKNTLGKITVKGGSLKQKRIFYSALYHSLLTPNLYQDVDGMYRGMDGKVHKADGFKNYTVFSLWDTFRALHPLLTIIEPNRTRDFVVTLLKKYEQYGEFPMWELAANDTRCMIGYHAVSVIADAFFKGITDFDKEKVLEAMVNSADVNKRGINYYKQLGFVPTNRSSQSVSKTLEYAYDDWCIAAFADAVGNKKIFERFTRRARYFENLFDPSTKFMRPRLADGSWMENFDPAAVDYNYNFTEGNSYHYSLFVPHDIPWLVKQTGGDSSFTGWLDSLFNTEITEDLGEDSDVSGLIGQYAHGNEPSHHMAYLYNYSGDAWKTQAIVRRIMAELYDDTPDGLCGNEDCGQMSAWYVFSAMGFYPVCPGMPEYVLGSPIFDEVSIHLDNGKTFTVKAQYNTGPNVYIKEARLNGTPYSFTNLKHKDITAGGTLILQMAQSPNKEWGKATENRPSSNSFAGDFKPPQIADEAAAAPSPAATVKSLKKGLMYNYYEGIYRSHFDFEKDIPVKTDIVDTFDISPRLRDEWIACSFNGYIKIPVNGAYHFTVEANDGCRMSIDGRELFESDGRKSHFFTQTYHKNLKKGLHEIEVTFFQCSDSIHLKVYWEGPGFKKEEIPASVLFHVH